MSTSSPFSVEHLRAPLSREMAGVVIEFLRHKGSPWIEDIQQRVRGELAGAEDHYFLALADGGLVGHAWYTVAQRDRQLGLLGHVFTRPDARRRGIGRALMAAAMDHFHRHGGSVMQLFTSTPHSLPLYEQCGFECLCAESVYHERDWYMRHPVATANPVRTWFTTSPCELRALSTADLPQYCLLYNSAHDMLLKDRAQRIGSGLEAELAFIDIWAAIERQQGCCWVLDSGHAIVAAASLVADSFPHQSHVGLFDLYAPRLDDTRLLDLARHCLESRAMLGLEKLLAVRVDQQKRNLLLQLGFVPRGQFPGHYRVGSRHYACELLEWAG